MPFPQVLRVIPPWTFHPYSGRRADSIGRVPCTVVLQVTVGERIRERRAGVLAGLGAALSLFAMDVREDRQR